MESEIQPPANDGLYEDGLAKLGREMLRAILQLQKCPAMRPKYTKKNLTFY